MEKFTDESLSLARAIVHVFFDRVVIASAAGKLFHSSSASSQLGKLEQTTGNRFHFFFSSSVLSSCSSLSLVRICAERIFDYAGDGDREIADEKRNRRSICQRTQTDRNYRARGKFVDSKKIARYIVHFVCRSSIFDRVKPGRIESVTSFSNTYRYHFPMW